MSSERVSKNWQSLGIDTFSNAAILGTLAHYGVAIDEAQYVALAKEEYPFSIAGTWQQQWRGTGQFTAFPGAAAEQLWRRLMPGQICPSDVATALLTLCVDSVQFLERKKQPDTFEARFRVLESYAPSLPTGDRREKFMSEVVWIMGDTQQTFDGLAVELAQAEHHGWALRFAQLEELYFPVRKDVAVAAVQAFGPEKPKALETLSTVAGDASRDDFSRVGAVSILIGLKELERALKPLYALCDKAEAARDLELGTAVAEEMTEILKADPQFSQKHAMRQRLEKLAVALEPA